MPAVVKNSNKLIDYYMLHIPIYRRKKIDDKKKNIKAYNIELCLTG